uniref:MYB family transcription factor n=1 Tax=Melilotus albus TaxID=47082 RepID=A0A896WEL4_MELAB|nr:MYB family transcription factor [Melilotus albus]
MSSPNLNNDGYGFSLDLNISLFSQLPSSSSTPLLGHVGNNESLVIHQDESMVQNNEENEKFENTKLSSKPHWRPFEDAKLKKLVDEFGPRNWKNIAEEIDGRSWKSCRLRWYNQLDPSINHAPLSKEEEDKLLKAHTLHGNKWAKIRKFFHGRTDNALKNNFHVIMARKERELLSSISRENNVAITSTIDESNSTCTNLNFTTRPLLNYQAYGSQMGLLGERKVEARDDFAKSCHAMRSYSEGHIGKLKSVDQSNQSSESVATNMNNGSNLGENQNVRDKIKRSFIDFLGVGDT